VLHRTSVPTTDTVSPVSRPQEVALRRHALYEACLTTVLLFGVVSSVRWFVGPSVISRAVPICVGSAVAILVALLIMSPLGRASGGHLNPAISLAMWRYGTFSARGVPYYGFAQLSGSVLGVLAGRLLWGVTAALPPVTYAALHPEPALTYRTFFLLETLTMAFIIWIVGIVLGNPASPRLSPL
jgi:glycerol uptake facilitator-like aquaporin